MTNASTLSSRWFNKINCRARHCYLILLPTRSLTWAKKVNRGLRNLLSSSPLAPQLCAKFVVPASSCYSCFTHALSRVIWFRHERKHALTTKHNKQMMQPVYLDKFITAYNTIVAPNSYRPTAPYTLRCVLTWLWNVWDLTFLHLFTGDDALSCTWRYQKSTLLSIFFAQVRASGCARYIITERGGPWAYLRMYAYVPERVEEIWKKTFDSICPNCPDL